jgi:hypothetical protein
MRGNNNSNIQRGINFQFIFYSDICFQNLNCRGITRYKCLRNQCAEKNGCRRILVRRRGNNLRRVDNSGYPPPNKAVSV